MIYTRFGTKIKIIGGNIEKGYADWIRIKDKKLHRGYIIDLKADKGLQEIEKAIKACGNKIYIKK